MNFLAKIRKRGTVTIPSEIRLALSLKEGDLVELEIKEKGREVKE